MDSIAVAIESDESMPEEDGERCPLIDIRLVTFSLLVCYALSVSDVYTHVALKYPCNNFVVSMALSATKNVHLGFLSPLMVQ
jgi:hypothetical protein